MFENVNLKKTARDGGFFLDAMMRLTFGKGCLEKDEKFQVCENVWFVFISRKNELEK